MHRSIYVNGKLMATAKEEKKRINLDNEYDFSIGDSEFSTSEGDNKKKAAAILRHVALGKKDIMQGAD